MLQWFSKGNCFQVLYKMHAYENNADANTLICKTFSIFLSLSIWNP